jgi:hypothetical protein
MKPDLRDFPCAGTIEGMGVHIPDGVLLECHSATFDPGSAIGKRGSAVCAIGRNGDR